MSTELPIVARNQLNTKQRVTQENLKAFKYCADAVNEEQNEDQAVKDLKG